SHPPSGKKFEHFFPLPASIMGRYCLISQDLRIMASRRINPVLKHIQRLIDRQEASAWTDQQLLDRFISRKEEAAFTALVRRHGAMVLALGSRILRQREDAEDVFQAAFLVLARKARSIRKQESIGGWLYRVAFRQALRVRAESSKRGRPTPSRPE